MSWEFGVGSGDSSVLIDDAVEHLVPTDWGVDGDRECGVVVGRALLATLVWAVVVEMLKVLVEDRGGVAFVVDQDPVGALCPDAAHESFRVAVCSGGAWRDFHDVDAFAGEHRVERGGEFCPGRGSGIGTGRCFPGGRR